MKLQFLLNFALQLYGASSFSSHDIVRESSSLSNAAFAQLSWQVEQGYMFSFLCLIFQNTRAMFRK